jgi:hypothetical protein
VVVEDLAGPLHAGRAGGLVELTQRLASWFFALRVWVGLLIDFVGWVECVRVGRRTPVRAARNPSSAQVHVIGVPMTGIVDHDRMMGFARWALSS